MIYRILFIIIMLKFPNINPDWVTFEKDNVSIKVPKRYEIYAGEIENPQIVLALNDKSNEIDSNISFTNNINIIKVLNNKQKFEDFVIEYKKKNTSFIENNEMEIDFEFKQIISKFNITENEVSFDMAQKIIFDKETIYILSYVGLSTSSTRLNNIELDKVFKSLTVL